MRRPRRPVYAVCAIGLVACALLSSGCILAHDNVSINLIVPLGFGGSPGIFNPFGIVQALVNSLLGAALPTGMGGGSGAPSSAPPIDLGAIGAVVTRP